MKSSINSVKIIKVRKQLMKDVCESCCHKQDLIHKYTKLIKLLKTKYQKSSKSTLQSQKFSTQSILQSCVTSMKGSSSNTEPGIFESYQQPTVSIMNGLKPICPKLAIVLICNKAKKSLLKSFFDNVKEFAKQMISDELACQKSQAIVTEEPPSLLKIIEETMSHAKSLQSENLCPVMTLKSIYANQFSLQNVNYHLREKVVRLQQELKESEKRFYKQTQKKRQSLEAVAQEIREKEDFIAELQHSIKQYEKMSGKSFKKINLQNVLIEDEIQLKKTCLRLEGVNEKLNSDLRNAQTKILELNSSIFSLQKQNLALKAELSQFKEQNFDLAQQINKTENLTQTYTNLCRKLNQKLERIKLTEKKGVESLKCNSKGSEILSCGDNLSFKNTEASSDPLPLSRKSSLRDLQAEQKLESIFSFLFNIREEGYRIMNEDMFDEDQLNLLKGHKNTFLNSVHNQNPQNRPRTEKTIKKSNLNETDEVFFIQQLKSTVQNSFLNALEPQIDSNPKQNTVCNNLKLMDMEIEKSKLIEKISDLKKVHMHIREILLKLLKTIEFSNFKQETIQILEIIFEVFEYSEDEKSSFIKEKKKKLWGIL